MSFIWPFRFHYLPIKNKWPCRNCCKQLRANQELVHTLVTLGKHVNRKWTKFWEFCGLKLYSLTWCFPLRPDRKGKSTFPSVRKDTEISSERLKTLSLVCTQGQPLGYLWTARDAVRDLGISECYIPTNQSRRCLVWNVAWNTVLPTWKALCLQAFVTDCD